MVFHQRQDVKYLIDELIVSQQCLDDDDGHCVYVLSREMKDCGRFLEVAATLKCGRISGALGK